MTVRLPKSDPINFLVERRFPNYRKLQIPVPITRRGGISWDDRDKLLKKIETYGAELKELPREELLALYEQEKAKYDQERQLKAEQEEQQRFFNQPSAKADFVHWSKASYWTLDEAIALAFGKAPKTVTWENIKEYSNISPFVKKYAQVRDLARRAKAISQLYDPVLPGIFLAWAKKIEIEVPNELTEMIEKRGIMVADWKDMYDKLKEQYDLLKSEHDNALDRLSQVEARINKETPIGKSEYLGRFLEMAQQAINDYPSWRKTQKKVQKTGNLQDWLIGTIGADNREAEILKKVLSDIFQELS